jgi:hypothetical protein
MNTQTGVNGPSIQKPPKSSAFPDSRVRLGSELRPWGMNSVPANEGTIQVPRGHSRPEAAERQRAISPTIAEGTWGVWGRVSAKAARRSATMCPSTRRRKAVPPKSNFISAPNNFPAGRHDYSAPAGPRLSKTLRSHYRSGRLRRILGGAAPPAEARLGNQKD